MNPSNAQAMPMHEEDALAVVVTTAYAVTIPCRTQHCHRTAKKRWRKRLANGGRAARRNDDPSGNTRPSYDEMCKLDDAT